MRRYKQRIDLGLASHEPVPDFLLYKENHQQCWWFQKALAMPRIKYPSEARNHYKNDRQEIWWSSKFGKEAPHRYFNSSRAAHASENISMSL